MKRAVFLDRDGVLNELVLNPVTGQYEPPHSLKDLTISPGVIGALHNLQNAGYQLFVVSNQPDFAKGKASLEMIHAIHSRFDHLLSSNGIRFQNYYYCYHHPNGIVPEYSFICKCRKPNPYFLNIAAQEHSLDLNNSWMIGDRDSDIECGKAAGTHTILIEEPHSADYRGSCIPEYRAANLKEASMIILSHQ